MGKGYLINTDKKREQDKN